MWVARPVLSGVIRLPCPKSEFTRTAHSALCTKLKHTISRETEHDTRPMPVENPRGASPPPRRLSSEEQQRLDAALKYFSPAQVPPTRSRWTFRLAVLGAFLGACAVALEAVSLAANRTAFFATRSQSRGAIPTPAISLAPPSPPRSAVTKPSPQPQGPPPAPQQPSSVAAIAALAVAPTTPPQGVLTQEQSVGASRAKHVLPTADGDAAAAPSPHSSGVVAQSSSERRQGASVQRSGAGGGSEDAGATADAAGGDDADGGTTTAEVDAVDATAAGGGGDGGDEGSSSDGDSSGLGGDDSGGASSSMPPARPNVLLMVADDAEPEDIGALFDPALALGGSGSEKSLTPNLDALVRKGVAFKNAHAVAPLCAPSRFAILTGLRPACAHTTTAIRSAASAAATTAAATAAGATVIGAAAVPLSVSYEAAPRPSRHVTLGHKLSSLGYATGLVGLWHLGLPEQVSKSKDLARLEETASEKFATGAPRRPPSAPSDWRPRGGGGSGGGGVAVAVAWVLLLARSLPTRCPLATPAPFSLSLSLSLPFSLPLPAAQPAII